MKRLFSILLAFAFVFTLAACGGAGGNRPVPTFSGVEDKTINVGDIFKVLEGVKAVDADGVDITASIEYENPVNPKKEGRYTVVYTVTDSKGATGTASRVITVVKEDKEGPMISGAGDLEIIVCGDFNKTAGVVANDTIDGDVTSSLTITGDVDVYTPGKYTLTYEAQDSHGNKTTLERNVTVVLGAFRFSAEEMVEGDNVPKSELNTLEYGYGVIKVIVTATEACETKITFNGAISSASSKLVAGDNEIYIRYIRNAVSETKEKENIKGTISTTAGTVKGYILGVPSDITPPIFKFAASYTQGETIYLPKTLQGVPMSSEEVVSYIKNISGIQAFDVRDNKYPDVYVKEIDMSKTDEEQFVVLAARDDTGNEATYNQKLILVSTPLAMDTLDPTRIQFVQGASADKADYSKDTVYKEMKGCECTPVDPTDATKGFNLQIVERTNLYYEDKVIYLMGSEFTYGEYYMITIEAKSTNADFYTTMRICEGINGDPWSDYYVGNTKQQIVFNKDDYTTYNFIFKRSVEFNKEKYWGPCIEWDVASSQSYGPNEPDNILEVKTFILYALSGQDAITSPYEGGGEASASLYPIRDLAITDGKITFTERVTNADKYTAEIYKSGSLLKSVDVTNNMNISDLNLPEGIYSMKVKYSVGDVEAKLSNLANFTVESNTPLTTTMASSEFATYLNTMGRVDANTDGSINFYYTASGFRVTFTGTKMAAVFDTKDWNLGAGYIVVMVDGEMYPEGGNAIALNKGNGGEYTLCLGLENKEHVVEVLKRSEASNNTFTLKALKTDGSFGAKPADRTLNILAIGASGSTGYGNLSTVSQSPENSDGMRAFPYLVARAYDANITEINASGWGLLWGWNDETESANLYKAFSRKAILAGNTLSSEEYSFPAGEDYDLIILNLGINDYNVHLKNLSGDAQMTAANKYMNAVTDFYKLLHTKYPNAVILVVQDDFDTQTAPGYANKLAITSECEDYVFTCLIPKNGAGTQFGSNSHANVQTHVWSADAILDWIKNDAPAALKAKFGQEVNPRLVYDASRDNIA